MTKPAIKRSKGIIVTYTLVFGMMFLLMLSGILGFILIQLKQSAQKIAWTQSLEIAEAGINFYRWCLNHDIIENCQGQRDYFDPGGALLGKFSLQADSVLSCSEIVYGKVEVEAWTLKRPEIKRKISVFYGQPSIAKYAYVLNSDVWIGPDHEIKGPYHSNGGIRMDGENQSLMSSAKQEWTCTSSFGCSPCPTASGCEINGSNCICPGVFATTQNGDPNLFSFPVPSFDFAGLTIDLAQMKIASQSGGIYLRPSKEINSQGKGYDLKFKDTGQVEIWIITGLSPTYAYSIEEGWHYDNFTISSEYLYNTLLIPVSCSLIFVEDKFWIEGDIDGKITVASANLIDANVDTDVILPGNIDYEMKDGSDGLTLIAERNILIGPQSPNEMELRGIFLAQKGRFSRNHYPGNFRDKLEIIGTIGSNGRVGTQWTSGSQIVSGYLSRETMIDNNLLYLAPPFTPTVGSQYEIMNWQEE